MNRNARIGVAALAGAAAGLTLLTNGPKVPRNETIKFGGGEGVTAVARIVSDENQSNNSRLSAGIKESSPLLGRILEFTLSGNKDGSKLIPLGYDYTDWHVEPEGYDWTCDTVTDKPWFQSEEEIRDELMEKFSELSEDEKNERLRNGRLDIGKIESAVFKLEGIEEAKPIYLVIKNDGTESFAKKVDTLCNLANSGKPVIITAEVGKYDFGQDASLIPGTREYPDTESETWKIPQPEYKDDTRFKYTVGEKLPNTTLVLEVTGISSPTD